jgi:hypothetical protein
MENISEFLINSIEKGIDDLNASKAGASWILFDLYKQFNPILNELILDLSLAKDVAQVAGMVTLVDRLTGHLDRISSLHKELLDQQEELQKSGN